MYKIHNRCRVCHSKDLETYIDLGQLPLSNNLCKTRDENPIRYPLKVMLCKECGLSQLSITINPEILFGHYVYRSSINKGYVDHCRKMAKDLKKEYNLSPESFMIDIAGNDGALLNEFKEEIGLHVLNIDPAANLIPYCHQKGIPHWATFWGEEAAHMVLTRYAGASKSNEDDNYQDPRADIITATNVFAHVDDVREFIEAAKIVLKPEGVLILEFPYLIDFIENNEFDTIYFEHLSYFSIWPLILLCNEKGLKVMKVERQDIHGGTVRVHIGNGRVNAASVKEYLQREILGDYWKIEPYKHFAEEAFETIMNFRDNILQLWAEGNIIAGFAASAKGNTLLNCAGISHEFEYIVDQTPEKIGMFSPGTGIEIVDIDRLRLSPPDYLVILSWNFAKEIKEKCRAAGYKGKFIIPIPEFKII